MPTGRTHLQIELERRLKEAGLSGREASIRAGLNDTAVKSILNGRSRSPRIGTIEALARILGCSIADLTGTEYVAAPAPASVGTELPDYISDAFKLAYRKSRKRFTGQDASQAEIDAALTVFKHAVKRLAELEEDDSCFP